MAFPGQSSRGVPPQRDASVAEWREYYQRATEELIAGAPAAMERTRAARAAYVAPYQRARAPGGAFAPRAIEVVPESGVPMAMRAIARQRDGEYSRDGWYSSVDFQPREIELPTLMDTMLDVFPLVPLGGRSLVSAEIIVRDPDTDEVLFTGFTSLSYATRTDISWQQARAELFDLHQRYKNITITMLTVQEWSPVESVIAYEGRT